MHYLAILLFWVVVGGLLVVPEMLFAVVEKIKESRERKAFLSKYTNKRY